MYMDLTDMISGGTEEQPIPEQKLTKEEYAAKKQQEREEVWAEVDSQAQGVFQDGEKLKGFLDFMAECNTQRTPNLLLIYGQHPDFKVVRSYERWRCGEGIRLEKDLTSVRCLESHWKNALSEV